MKSQFRHQEVRIAKWLSNRRRGCALVLAALLSILSSAPALASADPANWRYQVDLGAVPTTGDEAFYSQLTRTTVVTEWNACGQEFEFLDSVHDHAMGEGMLWAIMGKIGWLQTHGSTETCKRRVLYPLSNLGSEHFDGVTNVNDEVRQLFPSTVDRDSQDDTCDSVLASMAPEMDSDGHPTGYLDVEFEVSWHCMRRQVNTALNVPVQPWNIGTTGLPCGFFKEPGGDLSTKILAKTGKGEFDVVLRDLIRVLYLDKAGLVLYAGTRNHVLNDLLTVSGPLEEDSYSIFECGTQERDVGSPQDRADDRAFTDSGLLGDLGDLLDWLWKRIALFAAVAAALLAAYFVFGLQWLMAAVAAAGAAGLAAGFLRIPESENHLYMINSSRYLTNKLIIEALTDQDDKDTFEDDQEDIKAWLLERMQRAVKEDFREYNARPYQRYTIMSLLNIYDFSGDPELVAAAQSVLDFASAKFAAGSNQGRRIPPFRRLLESIPADFIGDPPRQLFELSGGADHQIAAMLLFAGQTQNVPEGKAAINSVGQMMPAASSSYRPDRVILEVATNKTKRYEQRIRHDGAESYFSTPGFLLSAGGIQAGLANRPILGVEFDPPKGLPFDNDRGAAMPTTLIPSASLRPQASVVDLLRIEGTREKYESADKDKNLPTVTPWSFDHNVCVWRGFACGTNIVVPSAMDNPQCLTTTPGAPNEWRFIDSAVCPAYSGAPHFYVILYRQACTASSSQCEGISNWGFFEAVDNPQMPFEQFKAQVVARNAAFYVAVPSGLVGNYVAADGTRVTYGVRDHALDSDKTGISGINNLVVPQLPDWGFAEGDIIKADGTGRMSIHAPGLQRWIDIDFTDDEHPKRTVHP